MIRLAIIAIAFMLIIGLSSAAGMMWAIHSNNKIQIKTWQIQQEWNDVVMEILGDRIIRSEQALPNCRFITYSGKKSVVCELK